VKEKLLLKANLWMLIPIKINLSKPITQLLSKIKYFLTKQIATNFMNFYHRLVLRRQIIHSSITKRTKIWFSRNQSPKIKDSKRINLTSGKLHRLKEKLPLVIKIFYQIVNPRAKPVQKRALGLAKTVLPKNSAELLPFWKTLLKQ